MGLVATPATTSAYDVLEREQLVSMLRAKDSMLAKRDQDVAQLERQLSHVEQTYQQLLLAFERLKRSLFGQKSERLSAEQQAFAWNAAMEEIGVEGLELPKPPPSSEDDEEKKKRKKAAP